MSYYQDLGIPEHATPDDIRWAYRRLVLLTHPDRTPDPTAHQRFLVINEAYETLSDPARRTAYDTRRKQQTAPVRAAATPRPHRRAYAPRRPQHRYNLRPYAQLVQIVGRALVGMALAVFLSFYVLRYTTTVPWLAVEAMHAPVDTHVFVTPAGTFVSPATVPVATTHFRVRRSVGLRIVHAAWLLNGKPVPVAPRSPSLVMWAAVLLAVASLTQWSSLRLPTRIYILVVALVLAIVLTFFLARVVGF